MSLICESIIYNYLYHKSNLENKILYKLPIIYSRKKVKIISFYFKKWKNKIIKRKNKIELMNNLSPIKGKRNKDRIYIFNDLEESESDKQYQMILKNINSNIDFNKFSSKISSISSNSSSRTQLKSKNNSKSNLNNINNKKQNTRNKKSKLFNKNINSDYKNKNKSINNFIQRQENFSQSINKQKEKLYKDSEDEFDLIYTFNPKINKNMKYMRNNSNLSIYNRLYLDSLDRKKKQEENEKNMSKKKSNNISYSNQFVFDELYLDHKYRKENHKKLINKIDNEIGMTFTPEINKFNKKIFKLKYNNNTNNNNLSNSIKLNRSRSIKEINNINNNKILYKGYNKINNPDNKTYNFIFEYIKDNQNKN